MTKTISVSDEAYEDLVGVKRTGESFSELARRLVKLDRRRALFDRSKKSPFTKEQADAMLKEIYEARDRTMEPRTRWP